ncbi:hypothetical protein LTR99_010747 [Exophiala xenobiotica]|uniref:TLC domain-containing protein n=1 Tax=Vermiconidia calcicola TaxID=1690605 RepID=A0AAV9PRZ4_9PEZI|nr:hypothetical protein H2202_010102 [Exophiala xenobiotica]KAK5527774.1 hypothetical protein LTR25_010905 [Vermiconidia calcicola]KAK5538152.1 hypothetical protein LTR23_007116 [Chaetothyriales sp. CCFEE 6169]KAK5194797.1 hypothetical protein LTR92_004926 [Exophiala xenobiotica]KAK5291620.1 hypothetical protein LTR99_010747 [Exophiala xenobiotica]
MATGRLSRVRRAHSHADFDGPHLDQLVNESVSALAPFAALILTITIVVLFLVRLCVIERILMRTKRYRCHFDRLGPIQQCTFINHHVAAACKVTLLFSAAYPFLAVAFGHSTLQSPIIPHHRPTNGDLLIVCAQIFSAMYIFELFFRRTISVISAAHHIGAVVITQSAVAISLDFHHEKDATFEFVLCFVWGAFDVVAEFWPHLAMILYRLYPGRHSLMYRLFLATTIVEIAGTVFETLIVFWLWGTLWNRWTLPFKIVTPILHALFSAAQLFGAWIFWQLATKEKSKMNAIEAELRSPDTGQTVSDEPSKASI